MEKRLIITGGNRGIGLEILKQHLKEDYQVLCLCRQSTEDLEDLLKGPQGKNLQVISQIELSKPESWDFFGKMGNQKFNRVIQNAGIFRENTLEELNVESIIEQLWVNSVAPLILTQKLLPSLQKGSQVFMVTSWMGSIGETSSGGYYGYRASKAALNMFTKTLSCDVDPEKTSFFLLHPGYVKTRMTSFKGDITPEESARTLMIVMNKVTPRESGTFWHQNGSQIPW